MRSELPSSEVRRRVAESIVAARQSNALLPASAGLELPERDAYAVQDVVVAALRQGERRVGWKLGYTSAAMRQQMGVAEPNFGPLFESMLLTDGAVITRGVVQPKVEPELAAVLARDVDSIHDLPDAVARWHAALEVVDSVWERYRFTWALNTADGSSAAFVVLGAEVPGDRLDRQPVSMARNGTAAQHGWGRNAMGDPWTALEWLVEVLAERGEKLRAGDVVITGGLTAAVDLTPGDTVEAVVGTSAVRVSLG